MGVAFVGSCREEDGNLGGCLGPHVVLLTRKQRRRDTYDDTPIIRRGNHDAEESDPVKAITSTIAITGCE